MAHTTVIPPVDRRTFGHGAFAVQASEATRRRADQLTTDGAREHDEHEPDTTRRRILDQWSEFAELGKTRGIHTPAVERFHNEVALLLAVTPDPVATLDRVLCVFARERAKNTPGACTVYPGLCTSVDGEDGDEVDENGHHFDHGGRTYYVPGSEISDDPEIWATFTHLSGSTPRIGFMGEDLTTGQAREKAAQMRKLADEMDALADQVDVAVAATEVTT